MTSPSRIPKLAVASPGEAMHTAFVPLTLQQVLEEISQWPEDLVAQLVDRIVLARHGGIASDVDAAWREEIHRRVDDIRTGKVQGIPGDKVSARIRKIVGR